MKCSAYQDADGVWHDVFKDPITDPGKKSKRGRLAVVKTKRGYHTVRRDLLDGRENQLKVIFKDGETFNEQTFEEIRLNSENS